MTALDWMRGLVMVLMTVDHASLFFNQGRVADDSVATYTAGSPLPLDQFLLRWATHLCAPTFLFLAGTGLALSNQRRMQLGLDDAQTRRDLLVRGTLIVALDLVYMSFLAQHLMLQVLYAIGLSMILMAWLRKLPDHLLAGLAAVWFFLGEMLTGALWDPPQNAGVALALAVARHADQHVWIFYPVVPWLAIMALGWVFGNQLHARGPELMSRALVAAGVASLGLFALVRGLSGYGNMWLQREDGSLQQWLHVSKYPPSLSYASLELGLMALCLAVLMWLSKHVAVRQRDPVLVFGQTALFFYLAHFTLLGTGRRLFGIEQAGPQKALIAALAALVILYPCCLWFRAVKRTRPNSWLRFI